MDTTLTRLCERTFVLYATLLTNHFCMEAFNYMYSKFREIN